MWGRGSVINWQRRGVCQSSGVADEATGVKIFALENLTKSGRNAAEGVSVCVCGCARLKWMWKWMWMWFLALQLVMMTRAV